MSQNALSHTQSHFYFSDYVRAAVFVLIWGLTWIAFKYAVDAFPPMVVGALRYTLVFFPICFFIPRPKISLKYLIPYGFLSTVIQIGMVFLAYQQGTPPGMAALIVQMQTFFSVILALLFLKEKFQMYQLVAILVGLFGLYLVESTGAGGGQSTPILGLIFLLFACFGLSASNIVVRKMGRVNGMSLIVWGGAVGSIGFWILALIMDGPQTIAHSIMNAPMSGWLAMAYMVILASYGATVSWATLMNRHPVRKVAPITLLVPVVALISTHFWFGETFTARQIGGAALIMLGLVFNMFAARIQNWLRQRWIHDGAPKA